MSKLLTQLLTEANTVNPARCVYPASVFSLFTSSNVYKHTCGSQQTGVMVYNLCFFSQSIFCYLTVFGEHTPWSSSGCVTHNRAEFDAQRCATTWGGRSKEKREQTTWVCGEGLFQWGTQQSKVLVVGTSPACQQEWRKISRKRREMRSE